MMSCTTRFLMSSKSQVYCRTASAVPWNHSLSVGVCVAASTCTGSSQCASGSWLGPLSHMVTNGERFIIATKLCLALALSKRCSSGSRRP